MPGKSTAPLIGVLALQGGFAEHLKAFLRLGASAVEIRSAEQLGAMDALVIPGGESTSMGLLAEAAGLVEPLRSWTHAGRPTWGTCAGLILLADRVRGQKEGGQSLIGGLDITVDRNHFGGQLHSRLRPIEARIFDPPQAVGMFIRAPAIVEWGSNVEAIATLPASGICVGVRQGSLLGTTFHPELTEDPRWHAMFLAMSAQHNNKEQGGSHAKGDIVGRDPVARGDILGNSRR